MKTGLAQSLLARIPLLRSRASSVEGEVGGSVPIEQIEWREFEQLVTESFRRRGYHAPDTTRAGDAGGDHVLRRDRETYLLHCAYWRHAKVGVGALQTLHKAMLARSVNGAFVVSFGRFGRDAAAFAGAQRIQLIDGPALKQLLEPVRASLAKDAARTSASDITEPAVRRAVPESPGCPMCGKPMRMRTAKRGSHAGRGFWGCIGHPDCKGIRPIV